MTTAMMASMKDVIDDGQHAFSEHVVDGVDVGSEARDEAADGVNIEESNVHALHVAKDVAAQVEHDFLPDPLHQVDLNELEEVRRDQHYKIDGGQPSDALHRARGKQMRERTSAGDPVSDRVRGIQIAGFRSKVAIDGHHHEDGPGNVAERLERNGERGDAGLQPIGTNEVAEAAHQLRVVNFADDFIVSLALRLDGTVLGAVLLGLIVFFIRHRLGGVCFLLYCTGARVLLGAWAWAGAERRPCSKERSRNPCE